MPIDYSAFPATASPGSRVILEATGDIEDVAFQWIVPSGTVVPNDGSPKVTWNIPPRAKPGAAEIRIVPTTTVEGGEDPDPATLRIELTKAPLGPGDRLNFPEGAAGPPAQRVATAIRPSSTRPIRACGTSSGAAPPGCRSTTSSASPTSSSVTGPNPIDLPADLQARWRAQRDAFQAADRIPPRRLAVHPRRSGLPPPQGGDGGVPDASTAASSFDPASFQNPALEPRSSAN